MNMVFCDVKSDFYLKKYFLWCLLSYEEDSKNQRYLEIFNFAALLFYSYTQHSLAQFLTKYTFSNILMCKKG